MAGSGFLAYLLWKNNIASVFAINWLSSIDMTLLFVSLLYGGISIYRSVVAEESHSMKLILGITIPGIVLFLIALSINFSVF